MEVKRYEEYGINNDNDDNNIQKSENPKIQISCLLFVLCSFSNSINCRILNQKQIINVCFPGSPGNYILSGISIPSNFIPFCTTLPTDDASIKRKFIMLVSDSPKIEWSW